MRTILKLIQPGRYGVVFAAIESGAPLQPAVVFARVKEGVRRGLGVALFGMLSAGLAACSESDPVGPGEEEDVETLTVDASEGWALVALGDEAHVVTAEDAQASEAWDLGFFATDVMLNGGAAGPGGVMGYCVCQNASATDDDVIAMTADSELQDFRSVDASALPDSAEAWVTDALAPAIDGWYAYDPAAHVVSAAPEHVWKVRTASGTSYAKFHVTGLEDATQEHAGQVTFEYAVQPQQGAAFGSAVSATVDVSAGVAHVDLETGAEVEPDADWDLRFEGYEIRVNGGISGDAQAGAALASTSFEEITDASDLPEGVYQGDAFGGVFVEHPWYRYNLEDRHQIWPTYDVFLVQRGDELYKIQVINYYGPTGDSRQITFRYARVRP